MNSREEAVSFLLTVAFTVLLVAGLLFHAKWAIVVVLVLSASVVLFFAFRFLVWFFKLIFEAIYVLIRGPK